MTSIEKALRVLVHDEVTREWLIENDPNALEQAEAALNAPKEPLAGKVHFAVHLTHGDGNRSVLIVVATDKDAARRCVMEYLGGAEVGHIRVKKMDVHADDIVLDVILRHDDPAGAMHQLENLTD